MANKKVKDKEIARALYIKGMPTERICELASVCRQTLSRWIKQEGWDETRNAMNLSSSELKRRIMENTSIAIDKPEQAVGLSKQADAICKMVKSMNQIDKENSVVSKVDTLIEFENWLIKNVDRYKDVKDVVSLVHRMHDDFLTPLFSKR